jgi:DNA polymerase III delta subunit
MFLVFAGDDTYTSYLEATKAAQKLVETTGKELLVVDADDLELSELLQKAQSIGLFISGNVVLAKRLFDNAKIVAYLESNLEKVWEWPLVVWQPSKLDKRKKLVKQLGERKRVKEFLTEKPWQVEEWLQRQLEQKLTERVPKVYTQEVIERVGVDKFALSQEVEKIDLYYKAKQQLPDLSVLLNLGDGDIWKFLDFLTSGNRAKALAEFEKLLATEESDQYIIAMLAREMQLMIDVLQAQQSGRNPSTLGLHPFVLEKTLKKASRFNLQKLQKLTWALLRLDFAIKKGEIEPKVALTIFLLSW